MFGIFIIALFVSLTPGILFSIPKSSSKLTIAIVHSLIFALVYEVIRMPVWRALYEGFTGVGFVKGSCCGSNSACLSNKCNDCGKNQNNKCLNYSKNGVCTKWDITYTSKCSGCSNGKNCA